MYRTRQFHIKKNSRLYPYCKDLCSKSASLYNRANFVIRQYATAVESFGSMKPLYDNQMQVFKLVKRIEKDMNQMGYKTHIEHSTHRNSKARKIVVDNNSKTKNITSVLVSPGSKRHGETPYVKVSTSDAGRYKIVSNKEKYTSDGHENAKLYFARRKKRK